MVALVASLGVGKWAMHIDCHETTDTDDSEFRPAKASRDGTEMEEDGIPDGFYLVGDSLNPQPEWHAAMHAWSLPRLAVCASARHIAV